METGYDLARDLFRPHITLTRYRENGVPGLLPHDQLPAPGSLTFPLTRVGVYIADDQGAVRTELQTFTVQNA